MSSKLLYKYRSLENFKFFTDIVVNNRLYAAQFDSLNDPMEGRYLRDMDVPEEVYSFIGKQKKEIRIVSLSSSFENPLLWSHYANGHKGVAIGLKVVDESNVLSVNYEPEPFIYTDLYPGSANDAAREILLRKNSVWSYEEEQRVLIDNGETFVEVEIHEIVVGNRIEKDDYELVCNLVKKVNPRIMIKRASEEFNFWYYAHSIR